MTRLPRLLLHLLVLAVLGLSVGGCGFHLRGEARLPASFAQTYVTGLPSQDPLMRSLKAALRANGVTLVRNPEAAGAVLTLMSLKTTRRALTVSTLNQADSYALDMTLVFKAQATKGQWHMPPQTLSVQRQYSLSTAQLQSQGPEEQLLRHSMSRELANLVLLRLQAYAGRP